MAQVYATEFLCQVISEKSESIRLNFQVSPSFAQSRAGRPAAGTIDSRDRTRDLCTHSD